MSTATIEKLPSVLAARAKRILELMHNWTANSLALGKELKGAREDFKQVSGPGVGTSKPAYPGWKQWLKREIGMSEAYAYQLIRVAEKFGDMKPVPKVSFRVLKLLSFNTIPEAGRIEVIQRAERGEKIGRVKVKSIVNKHRPTPSEARKLALETKKPVIASDGNYYFGATKQQEKDQAQQVETVYGVRRAVETLATMKLSPHEFLKYAQPHQLWKRKEEHEIKDALDWLGALHTAWKRQ